MDGKQSVSELALKSCNDIIAQPFSRLSCKARWFVYNDELIVL
jgi:hypothetical protein